MENENLLPIFINWPARIKEGQAGGVAFVMGKGLF